MLISETVFYLFFGVRVSARTWHRWSQVMSAGEKETRLEAILTDTTTLCGQIEANSEQLKALLETGEDDAAVNARVYVLEQVGSLLSLSA